MNIVNQEESKDVRYPGKKMAMEFDIQDLPENQADFETLKAQRSKHYKSPSAKFSQTMPKAS